MAALSDYMENALLDHVFYGGTYDYTQPAGWYLALLQTASHDQDTTSGTGSAKELYDATFPINGYDRQAITFGTAASAGTISNTNTITFGPATADWPAATHLWVVDDAANGAGNIAVHGALASSKDATTNDSIVFSAGDLDITFA